MLREDRCRQGFHQAPTDQPITEARGYIVRLLLTNQSQRVYSKACGEDRVDLFFNRVLEDGEIPYQWKHLLIVQCPKNNLTKVDSYRRIALTSTVSKTLNRMIYNT